MRLASSVKTFSSACPLLLHHTRKSKKGQHLLVGIRNQYLGTSAECTERFDVGEMVILVGIILSYYPGNSGINYLDIIFVPYTSFPCLFD